MRIDIGTKLLLGGDRQGLLDPEHLWDKFGSFPFLGILAK
jgi:hypothetical protein